jgi:fructokinase
MPVYGAVEAGGTKFVCGIGTGPEDLESREFPTGGPEETIGQVADYLGNRAIAAAGIASFGPIDPDPRSATFGYITTTPKRGWRNFDLAGELRRVLRVPVGFDTDVNGSALGEQRWGAARGLETFLYVTVGTGIGGGAMVGGQLLHGRSHPEMGHILIPHDGTFPGVCPYHGACLEGLASGPAIEARWGCPGSSLPPEHPAWDREAEYLAAGLLNCILTLSPQRVILGGGVPHQKHLFPLIREKLSRLLNGYYSPPEIVAPELGDRSGVLGALVLAETAFYNQNT